MRKQIFLLSIFLFLTLFIPLQMTLAGGAATRTLEIVYPEIIGIETPAPQYISAGLPQYVDYVFKLAVAVVGFVILGALLYSGFQYLTSFGNPTKLSDAKAGIIAAFSGAAILLLSYLIFNTINPQLVIFEFPERLEEAKGTIFPGIYICNYKIIDIGGILTEYTSDDQKTRDGAVTKFKERIEKAPAGKICLRVRGSTILTHFAIKENSDDYTIFAVPESKFNSASGKFEWKYEYGFILHENDRATDKCALFPNPQPVGAGGNNSYLYHQMDNFHPSLNFTARAITLFKISDEPPPPESKGTILYQEVAFNQIGGTSTLASASFKPSGDADSLLVPKNELQNLGLYQNTKSIEIDPDNKYIAVLQGFDSSFTGGSGKYKCQLWSADDSNITDESMGKCGVCGVRDWLLTLGGTFSSHCHPCLEEMRVIKGQPI